MTNRYLQLLSQPNSMINFHFNSDAENRPEQLEREIKHIVPNTARKVETKSTHTRQEKLARSSTLFQTLTNPPRCQSMILDRCTSDNHLYDVYLARLYLSSISVSPKTETTVGRFTDIFVSHALSMSTSMTPVQIEDHDEMSCEKQLSIWIIESHTPHSIIKWASPHQPQVINDHRCILNYIPRDHLLSESNLLTFRRSLEQFISNLNHFDKSMIDLTNVHTNPPNGLPPPGLSPEVLGNPDTVSPATDASHLSPHYTKSHGHTTAFHQPPEVMDRFRNETPHLLNSIPTNLRESIPDPIDRAILATMVESLVEKTPFSEILSQSHRIDERLLGSSPVRANPSSPIGIPEHQQIIRFVMKYISTDKSLQERVKFI